MQSGKRTRFEKGSALVAAIMIATVICLLSLALITVTMSEFQTSIFTNDSNRAYFAAEAGMEKAAQQVDIWVGQAQDEARKNTSDDMKTLMSANPSKYYLEDGSVNDANVNADFDLQYGIEFEKSLRETLGLGQDIKAAEKAVLGLNSSGQDNFIYIDQPNSGDGKAYVESLTDINNHSLDMVSSLQDHKLKIKVTGEFKNSKRKLTATFDLLPSAAQKTYNSLLRSVTVKTPDIYKNAVVAEKNVISLGGGTASIDGDVLCFGTVPDDGRGNEDQSAEWYKYGGIMAGMSNDVFSDIAAFGFDPAESSILAGSSGFSSGSGSGSLSISGNAATFAYIHSLYGDSGAPSNITINGNSYARSIKLEQEADFSNLSLGQDAYTSDNLQIDSNRSNITVNGAYYGFSTGDSNPGGLSSWQEKRSSSVVINGDSDIYFDGQIYIGGSVFLNKCVYTDGQNNQIPYMSGLSAIRSSDNSIVNAFRIFDSNITNPSDILFWFLNADSNGNVSYNSVTGTNLAHQAYLNDGNPVNMMAGTNDSNGQPNNDFLLPLRAMHFKKVWQNWSADPFGDYSRIYTDNIHISGNGLIDSTHINGASWGSVAANGTIFDPYTGFDIGKGPSYLNTIAGTCAQAFHSSLQSFLSPGDDPARIDYVSPEKSIGSYYIDSSRLGSNTGTELQNGSFVFNGSGSMEIIYNTGANAWSIHPLIKGSDYSNDYILPSDTSGNIRGVIYSDKNIFVDPNYSMSGLLIASGNIVFLGNANIRSDPSVVDDFVNSGNSSIEEYLKIRTYQVNSGEEIQSQRVSVSNIKVVSWKEDD